MPNFFSGVGNLVKSAANTAVQASPYALQAIRQRDAEETQKKQNALRDMYAKNSDNRAERMTQVAEAGAAIKDEGEWEKAEPFAQDDGTTVMAQRNKRTGVYRPAKLGSDAPAALPSAIPSSAMPPAIPKAAAPPPMAADSQDMSGDPSTPMPPVQVAQTNKPPSQLRPYVKPTAAKFTPRNFKLNGKDVAGFTDNEGNYYDASRTKVSGNVAPYTPPVQQSFSFPVVGGPNGPTVARANNKSGQIELTDVAGKPAAAAGGSASLSPEDRQKMLNQAKLDHDTMKRIEQRVLDGKLNFGTAAGLAGAASQAHGNVGSEMLGVLGNAAAGGIDPDIQNYFTAQASYGRIMGNLQSKRYTDHQADIERRISGMQGNDLLNTIRYKQSLRQASIDDPVLATPKAAPAPTGRGGGRGGAPPPNASHPPGNHGADPEAAWAAKNPPMKGEAFDAYHARYLKSQGGGDE